MVSPGAETFDERSIVPVNPEPLAILIIVVAFDPVLIVRVLEVVEIEKSAAKTMSDIVIEFGGSVPLVPVMVRV